MRRIVTSFLLAVGWLVPTAAPALACSRIIPPTIEQLAGVSAEPTDFTLDALTGVYQLETVAQVPNMGLRQEASATVVTRYWGQPPGELGVQVAGGQWLMGLLWTTDCDPDPWPAPGESGYGFGLNGDPSRYVAVQLFEGPFYGEGTMYGELTEDQVAALDASFGPHTVVPVSAVDRAYGVVAVWWPNLLVLAAATGIVYLIVRGVRRRRSRVRAT